MQPLSRRHFLSASAAFVLPSFVHADRVGGLTPATLAKLRPAMEQLIEAQRGIGVVLHVRQDGEVIHHEAIGFADRENKVPMAKDTMVWIASMTKSTVGTATMMLVDAGKLSLDDPAEKYLPAFAKVKFNNAAPQKPITIRMLLSHTSGIGDPRRGATEGNSKLIAYANSLASIPLQFEPGTQQKYSFGLTVVGAILETVCGKPFETFQQENIFDPLGMKDTTYNPTAAQLPRIAKTYRTGSGGKLERAVNSWIPVDGFGTRMAEPSGGLFSTAEDMSRFYEMIRKGGIIGEKRLLSERAIQEMTTAHAIGGKPTEFGLGWQTPSKASAAPAVRPGIFGHGGAFGTDGRVDPARGLVLTFLIQNVNVNVTSGNEMRDTFHKIVYAS